MNPLDLLIGFVLGLATNAAYDLMRKLRAPYRSLKRRFFPEPDLADFHQSLEGTLFRVDNKTLEFMRLVDAKDRMAVDRSFEICHSFQYQGWAKSDFAIDSHAPVPIPTDIRALIAGYPTTGKSNQKYRIFSFRPSSSEDPTFRVCLAATEYATTLPIQSHITEPLLIDARGQPCSILEKYGSTVLTYGNSPIPAMVCAHVILSLRGEQLVLAQRARSGTDWNAGTWSLSFEEQMSSQPLEGRLPDRDFFDTVIAGLREELGIDATKPLPTDEDSIRILSFTMENQAVVDAIALVKLDMTLDQVLSSWKYRAGDSHENSRLATVAWTTDALAPMLLGKPLEVGDVVISPDQWHATSRIRALNALFHKFNIEPTLKALHELAEQDRFRRSE